MSNINKCASGIILKVLTSRMKPYQSALLPIISNVYYIIESAEELIKKESNILHLEGTFNIIGDIHGNVDDLIRIFEKQGYPQSSKYLFMGDYVDRGSFSVEVLLILYSLKVLFPDHIHFLRGNHESESICSSYGFKAECSRKYTQKLYYRFNESFLFLPFAAIVNKKYFCVHGGISPHTTSLTKISKIKRPIDSDRSPEISGFVWSDPNRKARGFQKSDRGVGFLFNDQKLNQFLERNNLELMIRSHQTIRSGMERSLDKCVTIFSSSNYCEINNDSCICVVSENEEEQYIKFSPLTSIEKANRRIIVPDWILENMELPAMKEPQPPVVDLSNPSSNIPIV